MQDIFKSWNIYLNPERFRKSKFTFDNVNFDLRKRSGFKYILQLSNVCLNIQNSIRFILIIFILGNP